MHRLIRLLIKCRFRIYVVCMSIFAGCIPPPYEPFVEDFPGTLSEEAIQKCMQANPSVPRVACELKRSLSSPIKLLAIEDLLISIDQALNKVGVPYWVDAGLLIGAMRFGAPLPWDDDVDVGVFEEDFPSEKMAALTAELAEQGLELKPAFEPQGMMSLLGREGLYHVSYTKPRYLRNVYKYRPSISAADAENMWLRYDAELRLFPHVDIFVFTQIEPDKYKYKASTFDAQCKGLFDRATLASNKKIEFLGQNYPGVENFSDYTKVCYGPSDILPDFVINTEHKLAFPWKVRLKNIVQDHPEYLRLFSEYLRFVFKEKYAGPSDQLR